jgi:hypothetical protein
MTTTNLNIPLIAANQAQKEVTANEAFSTIDAILNRGAVSRGVNSVPASPYAGDLYIIGNVPTGSWAGQGNKLTYYNTTWKFINPNEGITIWVNDEDVAYSWDGAAWVLANAINKLVTANSGSSYAVDFTVGNIFRITLTANCNLIFTQLPVDNKGGEFKLVLAQDASGGHIVTWPTSAKWSGGIAPTLTNTANSVDILTFTTIDGGTNWFGRVDGLDVR